MTQCIDDCILLLGEHIKKVIVPANNTSTTQCVFGRERSLFARPKTRDKNHGTSKEINLPATKNPAKNQPCPERMN